VKRTLASLALVLALGAVLLYGVRQIAPAPGALRDHFVHRGMEQTGSVNLVSSIYLGYRAFDTLGETVVLFLAVAGVMVLQAGKQ